MFGNGVVDCIGNVNGGCFCVDCCFDDLVEKIMFGVGCVFGGEFDIVVVVFCLFYVVDCLLDNFFLWYFEFEFVMDGVGGEKDVNLWSLWVFECFLGVIDIFVIVMCEVVNCWILKIGCNFVNCFEIVWWSDWKIGFDYIDVKIDECLGDFEFFLVIYVCVGWLFIVVECCIKNFDVMCFIYWVGFWLFLKGLCVS